MHAFLLIGKTDELSEEITKLNEKLGAKLYPHKIENISDVRSLMAFTKLKTAGKISILVENIDNATVPALNAFLKSLEEPQENLNFILTASTQYKVIPTVISRCQLIKVNRPSYKQTDQEKSDNFLKSSFGKRMATLSNIRERPEAIKFLSDLMEKLHAEIRNGKNYKKAASAIQIAQETINALSANGNVVLHLTNFLVKLEAVSKPR